MPIDYKKYPSNWKTEIRPAILERANNCCEVCKVKNGSYIFRGFLDGRAVYQDSEANVYDEETGEWLEQDAYAMVEDKNGNIDAKAIKVVLTISHLDHNINNNDYSNLKALCQLHHLRHDIQHHIKNARETKNKKKGLQELF